MNIGTPPITKEEIFSKIGSLEVYQMYMPTKFELNKNCLNPFQAEKNPSFRIYYKDGEAFHRSYNSNHKGDAIKFVMQLFGLSYGEALNKIAKDFGIIEGKSIEIVQKLPKIEKKEKKELILSSQKKDFTEGHREYLRQYGLNTTDLNCFKDTKVYALDKFWINGSNFPLKKDEIGFIYYIPKTKKQKIYLPFRDKKEKWWSSINFEYIHGLGELSDCNNLIITKSVKELLILRKYLPFCSIAVQAENPQTLSEEMIKFINSKAKNIYLSFDSDDSGVRASLELTKQTGWKYINVPKKYLPLKDWADLCQAHGVNTIISYILKKIK